MFEGGRRCRVARNELPCPSIGGWSVSFPTLSGLDSSPLRRDRHRHTALANNRGEPRTRAYDPRVYDPRAYDPR
eukprot:629456-Pyramimonas_sp.AAC.1